jgi:hypothetical protein
MGDWGLVKRRSPQRVISDSEYRISEHRLERKARRLPRQSETKAGLLHDPPRPRSKTTAWPAKTFNDLAIESGKSPLTQSPGAQSHAIPQGSSVGDKIRLMFSK